MSEANQAFVISHISAWKSVWYYYGTTSTTERHDFMMNFETHTVQGTKILYSEGWSQHTISLAEDTFRLEASGYSWPAPSSRNLVWNNLTGQKQREKNGHKSEKNVRNNNSYVF